MKYLTDYIWRKKEAEPGKNSILLLQVIYAGCSVVLACVLGNDMVGGYVTGGLKKWLLERGEVLFGKNGRKREILKELKLQLEKMYEDAGRYLYKNDTGEKIAFSGILIADQDCWVILGEESCIYFLNKRFQRTHCKRIQRRSSDPVEIIPGHIQRSVGLLLGNADFLERVSKEAIMQCSAVQDINRETQIGNRLKELTEESRGNGFMEECAAVYIKSV